MSDKEIENKMTEYVKSGKYNKDFKEFKTSRNITPQLHQYFDYIQDKQEIVPEIHMVHALLFKMITLGNY